MYSKIAHSSAGSSAFAIPFSFLDNEDISVSVDGVLLEEDVNYTISDSLVIIIPAPMYGASVLIERNTPITAPYTVFTDGATLTAQSLNNAFTQLLYKIQELTDRIDELIPT